MLCLDFQDPRNVGSAFRLADAVGAGLILAGSTPTPPNRKINKTARATVQTVPFEACENVVELIEARLAAGAYLLALEITDQSQSLLDFTLPTDVVGGGREVIVVPGTEAGGVPQWLLDRCHAGVHLPMYGTNTSMNVAVALGAAMYLLLARWQE